MAHFQSDARTLEVLLQKPQAAAASYPTPVIHHKQGGVILYFPFLMLRSPQDFA